MLPKLFIFISTLISSFIFTTHSYNTQCLHHQKTLLLQLKDELSFGSSFSIKLARWNESDECCKWPGVECDAAGYVISLQLDNEFIYSGGMGDSSSLFRLVHLQKLNLAYNDFNNTPIPKGIHNLTYLTHLNLSTAYFGGQVPLQLSFLSLKGSIPPTFANLTNLIHVDLSSNSFTGSLSSTLFEGLSNLVYLDLRSNSFSGNIPHSLLALPSLSLLDLSYNQFNGTLQLDSFRSLANLTLLALSYNRLSVDVSNINSTSYGSLQLKVLRLASCNLSHFPNFTTHLDMKQVDLSDNRIGGEIPNWIWETQLRHLDLSYNLLTDLQKPYHIPTSLRNLYLQSNQLKGHLPIPPASQLQYLYLGNNSLSGSIPTSLCSATNLGVLDLSSNRLSGSIPPCLIELKLAVLDLSQNNISGSIPDNFPMDCDLGYLDVNNNTLEGKVPKSLERCKSLDVMNVGNNNINDSFPCMVSSTLLVLVLHSNRFYGEVRCHDKSWSELQIVDISSNHFSGNLESINFSTWKMLQNDSRHSSISWGSLSFTLITKGINSEYHKIWSEFGIIDFSCNNFGGEILNAIGDLTLLHQLNLSHNSLNGSIPNAFGQLKNLESLDLSGNRLSGPIPVELAGLTFLQVLNLSYNKLIGEIPNGR